MPIWFNVDQQVSIWQQCNLSVRTAKNSKSKFPDSDHYKAKTQQGDMRWNNNSRPPRPPREGILFDVQITTREMSPLEMLLPNLSELAGLSIPQRFTDLENNNPKFD